MQSQAYPKILLYVFATGAQAKWLWRYDRVWWGGVGVVTSSAKYAGGCRVILMTFKNRYSPTCETNFMRHNLDHADCQEIITV